VTELRVSNVTSSPVTLSVWFVPTGSTADNQHLLINNVTIPVASNTNPYFDVGDLFGKALPAGSAVWMLAGTASALVVSGSGTMIV
jgi:hypothetical protein